MARDPLLTLTVELARSEPSPPSAPPIEEREGGRYLRLKLLGWGGMGEVWRVLDRELDRSVAMKVLRPERLPQHDKAGFLREAQLTAQLQHPGIIPVHEVGTLQSGEVYFTMKEVAGQTLAELVKLRLQGEPGWPLRRLVEVVRRAADAVAYAHSRGVAHRDLKPSNVMVGEFGEVYLLDWGLGAVLSALWAEAGSAPVAGTPSYMAPEQARGDRAAIGPATDVFQLGGVLFEVLTGTSPVPGESTAATLEAARRGQRAPMEGPYPIPAELAALCGRCLDPDPGARPADASALTALLADWLDGARRESQARALLSEADAMAPSIHWARRRAREAAEQARAALGSVPSHAPDEARRRGWALEDEARRLEREALKLEGRWLGVVRASLRAKDLPDANQRLADHFRARHEEAQAAGRGEEMVRLEAELRAHDQGRHASYLLGTGSLSLHTHPTHAEVELYRLDERDRRLQPVLLDRMRAPVQRLSLPHGSYLAVVRSPGHLPLRVPMELRREQDWDGVPPGESDASPVWLPPKGSLGPDDLYVPGGWAWIGGDPEAGEPLPRARIWIESFVIRRFPVTNEEFLAFLNARVEEGRPEEAALHAPRDPLGEVASRSVFGRETDGRYRLGVDEDGAPLLPRQPVRLVTWFAACAYAAWEQERSGLAWRLPDELEWEKAARGVDGRPFVWGSHREPSWANVLGARDHAIRPTEVGAFPLDESIYGVRDLAGNVRDWCANPWSEAGPRIQGGRLVVSESPTPGAEQCLRGGAWTGSELLCRIATRFAIAPGQALGPAGFRLARSAPPPKDAG